jgi:hypothetical protein
VLGGAGGGEDLAVGEGLVAGDVVEMPVAEQDGDLLDTAFPERPPDEAAALDRDVRVVDQRLAPRQQRVARDPERDRPLIDPVRLLGEAVPLDPSLVEGEDVRSRLQNADRYLVPSKSQVCSIV